MAGTETMGNKLFPKFGEFDSYEEINRAAEAQLKEGDKDAIKLLAKENGLDEMDAEDYMSGFSEELCTEFSAAVGKIQKETEYLKPSMTLEAWNTYLFEMLTADTTASDGKFNLCVAVRKKGKYLSELYAKIIVECFNTKAKVPKEVEDECRILDKSIPNTFYMGDISRARLKEIVREYYLS